MEGLWKGLWKLWKGGWAVERPHLIWKSSTACCVSGPKLPSTSSACECRRGQGRVRGEDRSGEWGGREGTRLRAEERIEPLLKEHHGFPPPVPDLQASAPHGALISQRWQGEQHWHGRSQHAHLQRLLGQIGRRHQRRLLSCLLARDALASAVTPAQRRLPAAAHLCHRGSTPDQKESEGAKRSQKESERLLTCPIEAASTSTDAPLVDSPPLELRTIAVPSGSTVVRPLPPPA